MPPVTRLLNRTTKALVDVVDTSTFSPIEWIYHPNLTAVQGVPPHYWVIDVNNVREMTPEEKATYDAEHLPALKAEKEKRLKAECRDSIWVRYPPDNQASLTILMLMAHVQQLSNRFAYIAQAVQWIDAALTYYYAKAAEITSATSIAELDAVSWDMTSIWADDPLVTIYQARQILD